MFCVLALLGATSPYVICTGNISLHNYFGVFV